MVSRKQRNIDSLRRKEGAKERKSVLIVCEGKKTEPIYFNLLQKKLRMKLTDVEVVHRNPAPISVVNHAIKLKKERAIVAGQKDSSKVEYEKVYCVMDVDKHESLLRAIDKAGANEMEVVLSNPCFEYWYILHFIKTGKSFHDGGEVVSELKKYYNAYTKSDEAIFGIIYPQTAKAIRCAKQVLREQHQNSKDLTKCNPATHVYKVVEFLRKMC
jgi:hypothetical protein